MSLEQLEPDLDPAFSSLEAPDMASTLQRPPRRDGMALGFGVAFIVFGLIGLARSLGADVPSAWIYPVVLIGLGVAGLTGLFSRQVR